MVRPIATNHKLDNMRKGKERTEDGIRLERLVILSWTRNEDRSNNNKSLVSNIKAKVGAHCHHTKPQ